MQFLCACDSGLCANGSLDNTAVATHRHHPGFRFNHKDVQAQKSAAIIKRDIQSL